MLAYSCEASIGGGKKEEEGEGKGDEDGGCSRESERCGRSEWYQDINVREISVNDPKFSEMIIQRQIPLLDRLSASGSGDMSTEVIVCNSKLSLFQDGSFPGQDLICLVEL